MPDRDHVYGHLYGARVFDRAGRFIGTVSDVFVDGPEATLAAIAVGTGLFKARRLLIPAADATIGWQRIDLPYTSAQLRGAPVATNEHRRTNRAGIQLSATAAQQLTTYCHRHDQADCP